MNAWRALWAACALLAVGMHGARARAETVVVLPSETPETLRDEQQEAQQMLRTAFTTQGARVMPYIEASAQAAGTDAADCTKLSCAPALLREVGAELAVALNVVRSNNAEPQVFVTLIDRQGDRFPGSSEVENRDYGAAAKDALIDARALQLLGPGPWLRVRTQPDGAQVFVDGELAGAAPYRAHLPPGRHRLEVRAEGHESAVQTVDLPSNKTKLVEVEVALTPRAGHTPGEAADAAEAGMDEPPVTSSPPLVGPIVLGVVGTALIVTDVVLVAGSGCSDHDSQGVCSKRAEVDTAWTVAWGATGVAAIAGGVLWYVLGSDSEPAVTATTDGRQLIVTGRF